MPFGAKTMAEQRRSLVEEIKIGERSISALCAEYGVSRPTAYKWLRRSESGVELYDDRSRAPLCSPNRTASAVEATIVEARHAHPFWGGRKLKRYLERKHGMPFPSASTVTAILHRHGLISREASQAAMPYRRFEMRHPNDLWQTDFKGHFQMRDGNRCHPLTVTDDHSRYSLCISAKSDERLHGVVASFVSLFREYGLPRAVLCDNGNPWGVKLCIGGYTKFDVFLMNYGILPMHGRPLHPQTQGKEERFHRTLKRELLSVALIEDLRGAQAEFDAFRKEYNEERPHCALGYAVPADRYVVSNRAMPERVEEWEYPYGAEVRAVVHDSVCYEGRRVYLSEALDGCKVAVMKSAEDGIVDVIYRNFRIAKIDLREKCVISKRAVRLSKRAVRL